MRETPPSRRWLTPGVRWIGIASFLSDLGHEVPTSLLPRFLTSIGGSAAALGVIEGVADGLAGIARLAGGALADDPHRRRSVAVGGYTSTAVLSGLIGVTQAVWQVGVLRAGAWAARGLRVPSRNALLADAVDPSVYGRAYGYERAMDNLGAIGGPLLALVLVAAFSVRTAIVVSVVPGLLAALAIVLGIRRIPRMTTRERQPIRLKIRPVMQGLLGRQIVGASAFELGNAAATLLILRATQVLTVDHGQNGATQIALILYAAYNAAASLISIPAGHASDRRGVRVVWAAGIGGFLVGYLAFAVATSAFALAIGFILLGLGIGCAETAQSASVAASAPFELRGSAFGLLAGVQAFGNLAASVLAGVLWTLVSPEAAFLYLAGWMVIALATLLINPWSTT